MKKSITCLFYFISVNYKQQLTQLEFKSHLRQCDFYRQINTGESCLFYSFKKKNIEYQNKPKNETPMTCSFYSFKKKM